MFGQRHTLTHNTLAAPEMGASPIAAAAAAVAAAAVSAVPPPLIDGMSRHDAAVLIALCDAVDDVGAMVATLRVPDVDPNVRAPASIGGFTALHVAALRGTSDVILYLVAAGAMMDARDAMGNTPLATAVLSGSPERVVALLRCGAAAALPLEEGEGPAALDLAIDMLAEDASSDRVRVAGALLDYLAAASVASVASVASFSEADLHCSDTIL